MRKRNLLVFLLLTGVWPVTGLSAQDAWKITAGQIEPPSYYGITVANGMLGLVSSPEPLKISRVVLGGLYDIYGKGRVNNFLHGINMLDTELQINGSTVTASRISGYKQTLDMRQGVFCGEFDYQSLARVEYQYTSLRHLPYSCLLRVRIIPKEDIEVAVANILTVHESLRNPQESFNRIFNGKTAIDFCTSMAKSPTRELEIGACSSFVFDDSFPRPEVCHRSARGVGVHTQEFTVRLQAGQPYTFSIIGTTLSSATHVDVKNEVERLTAFAAVEGVERLWSKHIAAWDKLWESDIVIEGDLQSQQDIHSMLYHTYAFVREGSGLSCSPMGFSGFGYNGHVFWDADTWIFPALLLLHPELAESMIEYRYQRLDAARHNAFMHGYKGAMYPWESSEMGNEDNTVTNMYGPFENHITGDVAMAAWQYYAVTQDVEWLRQKGFSILSAAAEYWVSRSESNEAGEYEIRNVIGADEWNQNRQGGKNVNNNAYTNGVAKSTLEAACKAAKLLNVKSDPMWTTVAEKLRFRKLANGVTAEHDTYDGAITKQADVCLLAFPLKLITDKEQIRKDLEFYLQTVPRKKTPAMSKSIYSILFTRLGDRERAWHYFRDSYLPNLNPPFRVIAEFDGGTNPYFLTGAGGVLQSVLMGFGGLDITDKGIVAEKGAIPDTWKSLTLKGIGKEKKNYIIK